jgi:hypothetical protein
MNRSQQRAALFLGLLVITAAMLGCASNERVAESAAYEQDLVRARTTIAQAEQAGASQYGSAQLALAREKLREAESSANDGESERARRLAVEAVLDAELARAITRNEQTQALVSEVRSGLDTLEGELRRGGPDSFDQR